MFRARSARARARGQPFFPPSPNSALPESAPAFLPAFSSRTKATHSSFLIPPSSSLLPHSSFLISHFSFLIPSLPFVTQGAARHPHRQKTAKMQAFICILAVFSLIAAGWRAPPCPRESPFSATRKEAAFPSRPRRKKRGESACFPLRPRPPRSALP